MRKAFARCSGASIHQTVTGLTARRISTNLLRPNSRLPAVLDANPHLGVRCFHVTYPSRGPEKAPAQADADKNALITTFKELGDRGIIHEKIVKTLTGDMGLETLTEVQTATINAAIAGTDIIAQAKTGTGKTMAFLLPILQRIINVDPQLTQFSNSRRGPRTTADDIRALIVSPTRELAEQIAEEARRLTRNTGIVVQTAVGGTHKAEGLRAIQQRGCHLLVGTPGRLKDILTDPRSRVEAPDLSALVFDEADRLLDQGFWPDIQELMRLLPTQAEKDRQTLMFSATVPKEVVHLVRSTLKPGFKFVQCVRQDEEPTHQRVAQKLVVTKGFENFLPSLVELSSRAIEESKQPGRRPFKAIVYFNSTAEVALASTALMRLRNPSEPIVRDAFGERSGGRHPWSPTKVFEIHAKLTQQQRTRAADNFRNCESGILVSSDVTARGMDFPNVTHVIQVGLVANREQYIHRVGRTARAGKEGESWVIISEMEQDETEDRLHGLPLKRDSSLAVATLDLSQPADVPVEVGNVLKMYQEGIKAVSEEAKSKVYRALLGTYGWFGRKRILVQKMNLLAKYGWGMAEPPRINPLLASKLGISRIEGVRLGQDEFEPESRSKPPMRGSRDFGGGRERFGGADGRRDRFDRSGDRFDRSSGNQGRSYGARSFGDRQGGDKRFGSRRDSRPSSQLFD